MGRLGYFLGGAVAGIVGLFGAAWLESEYQMFKYRCRWCRYTATDSSQKTAEATSDSSNTAEATAETASA